jgi:hypothetical protein
MTPQQGVFSRAWSIIRRNPWLLLFGVLAGLRLDVNFDSSSFFQGGSWFMQDLLLVKLPEGLTVLGPMLVSLALWGIGLVARAGLIQATIDLDSGSPNTSFAVGWRQGLAALRPVILMQLIIWAPFIVLGGIAFFASPQLEALVANVDQLNPEQAFRVMMPLICGSFLILLPLLFVLSVVEAFAYRAIVLHQLQPWPAIRHGWRVMRDGLGEIIGTGIGVVILGFIYGLVIAIPFFALLFPFLLTGVTFAFQECSDYVSQQAFAACVSNASAPNGLMMLGMLLIGLVSALLGSFFVTYQSSVFTLLYNRLTGTPTTVTMQVADA